MGKLCEGFYSEILLIKEAMPLLISKWVNIFICKPKKRFCDLLNRVPMVSKKGCMLLGDEGLDGRGGINY